VAAQADTATWNTIHAMAKAEQSTLAKSQLYVLLCDAENPALADRALALAITAEPGSSTSTYMISEAGYIHPEKAFDFAVEHQTAVMANVDSRSATRFIPQLAYSGNTPSLVEKLQAWAKANLRPDAIHSAEESEAEIRYRVAVSTKRMPAIDAWLKANGD
jgi:aminopeptidase N